MKNRLRVLRAERNWSQADLAERLEVSRQTVNAIETGKYDPSLPLAFRLGKLFGIPIEGVFQDEEGRAGRRFSFWIGRRWRTRPSGSSSRRGSLLNPRFQNRDMGYPFSILAASFLSMGESLFRGGSSGQV